MSKKTIVKEAENIGLIQREGTKQTEINGNCSRTHVRMRRNRIVFESQRSQKFFRLAYEFTCLFLLKETFSSTH